MATVQNKSWMTRLLCSAAFVGAAGFTVLNAPWAAADPVAASPQLPPIPLNFSDPNASAPLGVSVGRAQSQPYLALGEPQPSETAPNYQLQVTASGASVGVPLNLSIAQHGNFESDESGGLSRQGRGAELRLGTRPAQQRSASSAPAPGWYVFAGSDNQALTWNPGVRNAFGNHGASFALQDRVEIGDHQAGVTYETGSGVQASLAYVERDVNAHVGNRSYSHDESFAGVTVTMRHH